MTPRKVGEVELGGHRRLQRKREVVSGLHLGIAKRKPYCAHGWISSWRGGEAAHEARTRPFNAAGSVLLGVRVAARNALEQLEQKREHVGHHRHHEGR